MIALCIGMVRSGSTWSYNVVRDLFETGNRPVSSGGYKESFSDWVMEVPGGRAGVVKCHAVDEPTIETLKKSGHTVRAIFTYRGAGPAIASGIRAFGLDFDTLAGSVNAALRTYQSQRQHWPTLAVPYSAIGTLEATKAIAAHFRLSLSEPDLKAVTVRHQPAVSRQRLQRVNWEASQGIYKGNGYTFHQDSLLHKTHFSDPSAADERFELTAERREMLTELLANYQKAGLLEALDFFQNRD